MQAFQNQRIEAKGLFFLNECGFGFPEYDHMSANAYYPIRLKKLRGKKSSLQSHCGGLLLAA